MMRYVLAVIDRNAATGPKVRIKCHRVSSGVAGHTPIRPGVKSIFRGKKIKKAKKLKKSNKKLGLRGVRCVTSFLLARDHHSSI